MAASRLTFDESQISAQQATLANTTSQLIQKRIRRIHVQNCALRICGMVCLVLSIICFIIGVTLMILDFDGNDDEYYQEDGVVKTRM